MNKEKSFSDIKKEMCKYIDSIIFDVDECFTLKFCTPQMFLAVKNIVIDLINNTPEKHYDKKLNVLTINIQHKYKAIRQAAPTQKRDIHDWLQNNDGVYWLNKEVEELGEVFDFSFYKTCQHAYDSALSSIFNFIVNQCDFLIA